MQRTIHPIAAYSLLLTFHTPYGGKPPAEMSERIRLVEAEMRCCDQMGGDSLLLSSLG